MMDWFGLRSLHLLSQPVCLRLTASVHPSVRPSFRPYLPACLPACLPAPLLSSYLSSFSSLRTLALNAEFNGSQWTPLVGPPVLSVKLYCRAARVMRRHAFSNRGHARRLGVGGGGGSLTEERAW
eukprot:746681-Hanusia_phi.AAC.3